MIETTREAMRHGIEGGMSDMAIYAAPWGVDFATINAPAMLWQGTADRVVPAELAFDLGRRLGNCRTVRLEGEGHFWVLHHAAEVVAAVAELARLPKSSL